MVICSPISEHKKARVTQASIGAKRKNLTAPYSVPGRLIVMDVAIAKREHVMYVRHAKLCIARAIEHKFSTSRSFTILLPVSP